MHKWTGGLHCVDLAMCLCRFSKTHKYLIYDCAGQGPSPWATTRHQVDHINVLLKNLRCWQDLYICERIQVTFAQIEEF